MDGSAVWGQTREGYIKWSCRPMFVSTSPFSFLSSNRSHHHGLVQRRSPRRLRQFRTSVVVTHAWTGWADDTPTLPQDSAPPHQASLSHELIAGAAAFEVRAQCLSELCPICLTAVTYCWVSSRLPRPMRTTAQRTASLTTTRWPKNCCKYTFLTFERWIVS